MEKDRAFRMKLAAVCVAASPVFSLQANAQIQRTFVNQGFEQPALTGSSCYFVATAGAGWFTSYTANVVSGSAMIGAHRRNTAGSMSPAAAAGKAS